MPKTDSSAGSPRQRRACTHPWRRSLVAGAACVLLLGMAEPAEAQRFGRRFRTTSPPRPAAPAPAGTAPRPTVPGQGPRPETPRPAKADARQAPQTTGTASPRTAPPSPADAEPAPAPSIAAADVAWDGVRPFDDAWRRLHPDAWRPEATESGAIVLAAAETAEDTEASGTDTASAGAATSVLEPSDELPDLLVFPVEPVPVPPPSRPAADGTVSVLSREGKGGEAPAPAGDPGAAPGQDGLLAATLDVGEAPWLPLGAFAALPEGGDASMTPHVFLELALHRDGTVRGNYFDALSDVVHPVAGRLDRDTGSIRWRVGSGPEFRTDADGLVAGRARATVVKGRTERQWTLIGLD